MMSCQDMETWQDANQQYLIAALKRVRQALERYAGGEVFVEPEAKSNPRLEGEARGEVPESVLEPGQAKNTFALERLCSAFGLS